ncbi:aldo/keto reductase [Swingsia samuiensis]|uniref:Aldo/keto reductase n=1 Tax=Swingsia samuiensis TaxID=1293412 RepID=A0A4Y6UFT6_9PROT|nr:aldo/keto reductase [Swingsia samuiensis]QDH16409.1 aldo/keto reductase [Swingsia samuiensis]
MKTVTFRNGRTVPALGMGTWNMGDSSVRRSDEIDSLRLGVEVGLRVIDTAEMYGDGRSESLVGEAISDIRDDVFLVSKVLPSNASYDSVLRSCRRTLKRLDTDWLDMYLLHWRGTTPLEETIRAFKTLEADGMIRGWGVSNFDVSDMEELKAASDECQVNQILYSLEHRGTEFDLLAYNQKASAVTMAYSPLGQGGDLLQNPVLKEIAQRYETDLGPAQPAQIALAWVMRQENVLAIPKAGTPDHLLANVASQAISLTEEDLKILDNAFPPPSSKVSLAVI